MPGVKFQPPHLLTGPRQDCHGRLWAETGGQGGSGGSRYPGGKAGVAAALLHPYTFPFQALEELSVAARFALGAAQHLPLWRLAREMPSQPQQHGVERGCPHHRQL